MSEVLIHARYVALVAGERELENPLFIEAVRYGGPGAELIAHGNMYMITRITHEGVYGWMLCPKCGSMMTCYCPEKGPR
jgi:hypothetical protein